ncbi:MAG TPA: potassium channel family protein [Methylocella sp.]|nr:potassium channel family protein [Methylocella sp.]
MRMGADEFQRRLRRAREKFGDRLLTWLTIVLVVLTFVIIPLRASGLFVMQGYGFLVVLVMAGCILGAPAGLGAVITMLFGVALGAAAAMVRYTDNQRFGMFLEATAWITVGAALAYVVARAVFAPGRVTYHRINGAVLLYLTIGQIFVGFYGVIDLLAPQAFSGLEVAESPRFASDLTYLSFVTLTTIGYGDILPVHPIARSLCTLEAIIGQLYPATLLARLVTLELEDRRQ